MSDLFNQPCADVLVIGVGSLGCALASRGALNDACEPPRTAEWAAIHGHSSELFATGLDRRILLASASDPFPSRSLMAMHCEMLRSWVKGKHAVLFAADAADAFAAETIPVLLEEIAGSKVDAGVWLLAAPEDEAIWRRALPVPSFLVTPPEVQHLAARAAREASALRLLSVIETLVAALHSHAAFKTEAARLFFEAHSEATMSSGACKGLAALGNDLMKIDGSGIDQATCILSAPGERTAGELKQIEDTLKSVFLAAEVTVADVPSGTVGDPWTWLLFARKAPRGNIVPLKSLRPISSRILSSV